MAGKSVEQRISGVAIRIRQLEAQKRLLAQDIKEHDRKQRTRLLIQLGAVMDRLGIDTLGKAQAFQQEVERRQEVRAWLSPVISAPSPAAGE